MRNRGMVCRGYADLGVYFMSVVHAIQREAERWSNVRPEVTEVVMALREGVQAEEGMQVKEGM